MDTESTPTAGAEETAAISSANHLLCGPLLGGIAAFLGGLAAWGVHFVIFPVFRIPAHLANLESPVPPEVALEQEQAMALADKQNLMLTLAIFGFAVAVLLMAAETYRRRCPISVLWRGPLAGVIAAIVGLAAGILGAYVFVSLKSSNDLQPLVKTIIMQAATLGLVGLGIGAGLGLSLQRFRLFLGCAIGGTLGGATAAVLYTVLVGYVLPNAQTERVMQKDHWIALLWLLITATMIGVVLGGLGGRSKASGE